MNVLCYLKAALKLHETDLNICDSLSLQSRNAERLRTHIGKF